MKLAAAAAATICASFPHSDVNNFHVFSSGADCFIKLLLAIIKYSHIEEVRRVRVLLKPITKAVIKIKVQ
jgi:hypothetical protein